MTIVQGYTRLGAFLTRYPYAHLRNRFEVLGANGWVHDNIRL